MDIALIMNDEKEDSKIRGVPETGRQEVLLSSYREQEKGR